MIEAIGAASCVIAVLQLSGKTLPVAYACSTRLKGAKKEIETARVGLEILMGSLKGLEDLTKTMTSTTPTLEALSRPEGPLRYCLNELKDLENDLAPSKRISRVLTWPLRERELVVARQYYGIIEDIRETCALETGPALAFFYFNFNDQTKQACTQYLCSLTGQLCRQRMRQRMEIPDCIRVLHKRHLDQQRPAPVPELLQCLVAVAQGFQRVFLITDALDECGERQKLLGVLEKLVSGSGGSLNVLVTSRKEKDIESVLGSSSSYCISVQDEVPRADFQTYIRARLEKDVRLQRVPPTIKDDIRTSLCRATLIWLAFSARPLRLNEVAEALAIGPEGDNSLEDERLFDAYDVLEICPSLATMSHDDRISLAYFSVKEYLVSDRLSELMPSFGVTETMANTLIAQSCLRRYGRWVSNCSARHNGCPALNWAAASGREAATRLLLAHGADVVASDGLKQTALHEAARFGHAAVCRVLLDAGADAAAMDFKHRRPLTLALAKSCHDIVAVLREHEAGRCRDDAEQVGLRTDGRVPRGLWMG
ncbi:hypothetical protein B0A49_00264 [Cryomyces minteri]|uniref:Uncharacterized protein n=1 Tax=Cryomyces minteri TaxID=331657 RepID=A0A4U0XWZ1_9PEZI|nr:hypothetical protein B0A49_00264 [Cryomyces minteri]